MEIMKTKEKRELFSKTIAELKLLLKEAENALFTLRMEHAKRKLKNTRSIFEKRKDIAKILTVIREKEFEIKGLQHGKQEERKEGTEK